MDFAKPGLKVLDLGFGDGAFSLALAGLKCDVLAVDGSQENCDALETASARSHLSNLHVINAIPGEATGPADNAADVACITVDDLIEAVGWPSVDVVKMSLEGNEIGALAGMPGILTKKPIIVFRSEGQKISLKGHSTRELLAILWAKQYCLMLIEQRTEKVLTPVDSDYIQAEAVVNYVAFADDKGVPQNWKKSQVLAKDDIVDRLLTTCAAPEAEIRMCGARAIAEGPEWLRGDPEVVAAVRALAFDPDPEVQRPVKMIALDLGGEGQKDSKSSFG